MTVELPFEFCAPVEHARDLAPEDGRQRRLSARAVDDPDLRPVGTGFPDDRPGNGGRPSVVGWNRVLPAVAQTW